MSDPETTAASFCRVTPRAGVLTAEMAGPSINERESNIILKQVSEAMDEMETLTHLVLDMTNVAFMPSVGIGMCITLHQKAKAAGAVSIIHGMSPDIEQAFRITKLDRVFTITGDLKQLEKALR